MLSPRSRESMAALTEFLEIFDARLRVGRVLGLEELDVLGAVDEEFEQLGGGNLLCGLGTRRRFLPRVRRALLRMRRAKIRWHPGVEAGVRPRLRCRRIGWRRSCHRRRRSWKPCWSVEARLPAAARARPPATAEDAAGAGVEAAGGGGVHAFGKVAVNQGARIENEIAECGQCGARRGPATGAAR